MECAFHRLPRAAVEVIQRHPEWSPYPKDEPEQPTRPSLGPLHIQYHEPTARGQRLRRFFDHSIGLGDKPERTG